MKQLQHKTKFGFSLIEVILAMAILGIIAVLMTPVIISAFHQITLSGDRHTVAKGVAADMEDIIAGEEVTSTLGGVYINLPGDAGLTVSADEFLLSNGNDARYVDLYGYSINPMPLVDPTTVVGTSGTTSTTASTSETSETSETTATAPSSTTAASPIDLRDVVVDVQYWKVNYKQGLILSTTTQMEYKLVRYADDFTVQDWTDCSNGTTYVTSFADNSNTYLVYVRQYDNEANAKLITVRAAPVVYYQSVMDKGVSYTRFYIYDANTGGTRRIKTNDEIKLQLRPGDIWNLVTNNYQIKTSELDVTTVYAIFAETNTAPASFPGKLY